MAQNANSSSSNKLLIGIIVVIVIILAAGTYKVFKRFFHSSLSIGNSYTMTPEPTVSPTINMISPTQQVTTNANTNNTQLDQDLQSIQSQLNQLNSDQNSVVQSLQSQSNDASQQ